MRWREPQRPDACQEIIPALWAGQIQAPSPFHSGAKCLRLRENFTLEPGINQSSGYKAFLHPYRPGGEQPAQPPQGSSAAPFVPLRAGMWWRPWADGCGLVKVGYEAAPALEKNSEKCAHHFNTELILDYT